MKVFYAKILLFGEYSVVAGSSALSVPFYNFSGQLDFDSITSTEKIKDSRHSISAWLAYIKKDDRYKKFTIDENALEQDIKKGLYFKSDIPQNYGMGSSGALVAALFHQYRKALTDATISPKVLEKLKPLFAVAESFFHGTSSGFDPVSIYSGRPLLYSDGHIGFPDQGVVETALSDFYLYDTTMPSSTGKLVNDFLNRLKDAGLKSMFKSLYLPAVELAIQSSCTNNLPVLKQSISTISDFQYNYMEAMIPAHVRDLWKSGLESGDFYFKLCGSGGGGYLLLWSDLDVTDLASRVGTKLIPLR